MSRARIALVVAVAVAAVFAAVGGATLSNRSHSEPGSGTAKRVPSKPGYWTKDRMRKAKPYPMPHPRVEPQPGIPSSPPGPPGGTSGRPPAQP